MLPRFLKDIHWPILLVAALLTVFGVFAIYSASFRIGGGYAAKQLTWAGAAILVFFVAAAIGYRSFLNISYILYAVTLFLLVFVLIFGDRHLGANRWLSVGPIAVQPSEVCKVVIVLVMAQFLSSRGLRGKQKRSFFVSLALVGVPFVLILKQPDLGSSLVLAPILLAMIFFWGIRIRYLVTTFLIGLAASPFLWFSLKPYQQKRLMVFLNPQVDPIGASYTAIQSKIAVGSGGLFGKGWLSGTQTQLDFVPEHHTDFIFSVIGEEFGFLGAFSIVVLFALLIYFIFDIMEHTTDMRAKLLALGIGTLLFFQVFVNIGMTIGLAPITGLTLPFMSYGGSSLVTTFFSLGLLVSIYRERSIF